MKKPLDKANVLWTPSDDYKADSNLHDYMIWLENNYRYNFESYEELWDWSVSAIDEFWESIMEYYRVHHNGKYKNVRNGKEMPYTRWFEGISLSFSEHIFRKYNDDNPAIIYRSETGVTKTVSWQKLVAQVSSLKEYLTQQGIKKGDRVVAYISNCPEAIVSFLAVNSIGAVWSSTSPDFGVSSVIDRFKQIEPKILIASSSYSYNGKLYTKEKEIEEIYSKIPSIESTIIVGNDFGINIESSINWREVMLIETEELAFLRVDFSDPIWVLYSSGTTGIPKAITHSVGGILLEHLKTLGIHNNVKAGEKYFWYSTTGWMMWNYMLSSLLHGATIVIYDGSPTFPNVDSIWEFAEEYQIDHLGLGASYINSCMKNDLTPGAKFSLKNIKTIGSTGSPLGEESFNWIYNRVSKNVQLCSISGGSDICSAFVGPVPYNDVCSGEIQSRLLGCDLAVYDDSGEELIDEVGEMVIKKAMPSMPIYFWNDRDLKKYKESYFEYYPKVWRHGDWTKITDRESIIIYGRSDATLNRGGIRIGSSEIYKVVEKINKVNDSLVINAKINELDLLILFVSGDFELTGEKVNQIKGELRKNCSPRHVPDRIYKVSAIPYTISGKKIEKPIKDILEGKTHSISIGSLSQPSLITEFEIIKKALE